MVETDDEENGDNIQNAANAAAVPEETIERVPWLADKDQPKRGVTFRYVQSVTGGYRSSLASKIAATRKLIQDIKDEERKPSKSIYKELETNKAKLEKALERASWINQALDRLDPRPKENRPVDYEERMAGDEASVSELNLILVTMMGEIENHLDEQRLEISQNMPPQQIFNTPSMTKSNSALKPQRLTRDATPVEFKVWKAQYRAYYDGSHMRKSSMAEQHFYLKNCLDTYLTAKLDTHINELTPVFQDENFDDGDSCFDYIEQEFLFLHPLFERRYNFFRAEPKQGQDFLEFMEELGKMGDECELHGLSTEDLYVYRYIVCCPFKELRRDFIKEQDALTRKKCQQLTKNFIIAKRADKQLDRKTETFNTSMSKRLFRRTNDRGNWSQRPTFSKHLQKLKRQNKCVRCGARYSKNHSCNKAYCSFCRSNGHNTIVCFKRTTTTRSRSQSINRGRNRLRSPSPHKNRRPNSAHSTAINQRRARSPSVIRAGNGRRNYKRSNSQPNKIMAKSVHISDDEGEDENDLMSAFN